MRMNEWVCLIVLLGASYTDMKYCKIKNFWIYLFFLFGMIYYRFHFLSQVLIILIILFPLYFIRVIGAGDLKLIALLFGYLRVEQTLKIIYIGLLFAGMYSTYKMISQKILRKRLQYLMQYIKMIMMTGKISKYHNYYVDKASLTIPIAPFLLLGFLTWRAYILWKMQV